MRAPVASCSGVSYGVAEDDDFAGEVTRPAAARPARTWVPRLGGAMRSGFVAGALPGALVGAVYYAQNHELDLPWLRIASLLAVYGPGVGILLAGVIELLVLACDRVARVGFGLGLLFHPVSAGALGGVLAGVGPGAIGVLVFGAYHGPFVGTALIAIGLISASLLIAVPAARRARAARGVRPNPRALAAAAAIATLSLCGLAAAIAPLIVDTAFAQSRALDGANGLIGAAAGALSGAIVGTYIGLVVAVGRALASKK